MDPEVASDVRAQLGEGPTWDASNGVLYWVDIQRGLIHAHRPGNSSDQTIVNLGERVSSVVPRKSGGLALTMQHGYFSFDLDTKKVQPLLDHVESEQTGTRFNDGKVDPAGRYWAGTMDDHEMNPIGSLYVLGQDRTLKKVLSEITISNGLGWSPDNKKMFYIDSARRQVWSFDYSLTTGDISNKQIAVDFVKSNQPGDPDGMAVDAEGKIWVAHWGGSRVTRWDPTAQKLLQTVNLPASHVTSMCFAGDSLEELYITTAQQGLDEKELASQPLAGRLFITNPGVKGMPTYAYEG
jgi:sugar lactone lactonase YvrE